MTQLEISKIRIDSSTQSRSETDGTKITEYANAYRDQALDPRLPKFPPIVVFFDGQEHHLASGWHRFYGAKQAEFGKIDADIRQGTLRDAVLFSVGENATHGIPRTGDDMRRAVRKLLEDDEWRARSDHWCAAQAKVNPHMVAEMREQMYPPSVNDSMIRMAKRGASVYPIDTSNLSRKPAAPAPGLYSPPASTLRPSGHREPNDRPRFLAVDEAMQAIAAAQRTLPDPQTAASEHTGFDLDEAYRISLWWTKFASHLRQRIERAG